MCKLSFGGLLKIKFVCKVKQNKSNGKEITVYFYFFMTIKHK